MKVAISIPDQIYKLTDREARRRKMSRSGLVAEALAHYFSGGDKPSSVTRRLNALADEINRDRDPALNRYAVAQLRKTEW